MNIRQAIPDDLSGVLDLCKEYIPQLPYKIEYDEQSCTNTFNRLVEQAKDGTGIMIIVEDEGIVAGMLGAFKVPLFFNENHQQSSHWFAYVSERFKGRGYGKLLYRGFDMWSQGSSFQSVGAHTNNSSLVDWYEKEGYTLREYVLVRENSCL